MNGASKGTSGVVNLGTVITSETQPDWNVTNTSSAAYIKNKPTIPSGAVVDDHMDSTSENPVQNKVIVSELSGYLKTTDIVPITNAEIDTIVAA